MYFEILKRFHPSRIFCKILSLGLAPGRAAHLQPGRAHQRACGAPGPLPEQRGGRVAAHCGALW